jgi:hypothetical protein
MLAWCPINDHGGLWHTGKTYNLTFALSNKLQNSFDTENKTGSWFSRKILRRTSSNQSVKPKPEQQTSGALRHRRSISDLSLRLKNRNDRLKDKDLQELVRLCGSSLLYLPAEYATGSLVVPTCFRAAAQYLVQHGQ